MVWKLKSCPRCGGDTFIDKDEYTWYEQCLQCGYTSELKKVQTEQKGTASERRPTAAE